MSFLNTLLLYIIHYLAAVNIGCHVTAVPLCLLHGFITAREMCSCADPNCLVMLSVRCLL